MAALQYVDVPGYSALLLMRTMTDLDQTGSLGDRLRQWLEPTSARWDGKSHCWRFPSGATISLGYLGEKRAEQRYKGPDFSFIAFDELTRFEEEQYRFLFSRLRKGKDTNVPSRMRAATNPGDVGHCIQYGIILTPSGWRDVRDFKVGDPVYAVSQSGELRPSVVEQVHRMPYDGDMVRVSAGDLRMNCTPEHRVAKVGGSRGKTGERFTLTPFDELPGQATVLRSVQWKGEPIVDFSPPVQQTRRRKVKQPASLGGDLFAELMGWFLSEGCTVDRDKAFDICQMKPEGRKKIADLLTRCGFKYGTTGNAFRVHAADWWAYLRQFGKCRDKFIPGELRGASLSQLRLLFDSLMAGDGHATGPHSGQYYTSSKRLAEDVAEVALKLGHVTSIYARQRPERDGLCYAVNFKRTKSGGTEILTGNHVYSVQTSVKRKSDIKREPFSGEVYCIGVPEHHAFVVMQDGAIWISGNSWVKQRFIPPEYHLADREGRFAQVWWNRGVERHEGEDFPFARLFVPARLEDNPSLDAVDYEASQRNLPPILWQRMRRGDWQAHVGGHIDPQKLVRYRIGTDHWYVYSTSEVARKQDCQIICTMDPAGGISPSAKYTAIPTVAITPKGMLLVLDMIRERIAVEDIVPRLADSCLRWSPQYVGMEDGFLQSAYIREAKKTRGIPTVEALSPEGKSKLVRGTPLIIRANAGGIAFPESAPWVADCIAELASFTGDESKDAYTDQFDALGWAVICADRFNFSRRDDSPMGWRRR